MLTVFGILASAIALFAWGRPRVDIVAILVVLALMLSRVLTPREAFAGFGDPVVVLIAAIFIVGEALVNTGVVHRLGEAVMKLGGGNETRLILLIPPRRKRRRVYELLSGCRHVHPSGPDCREEDGLEQQTHAHAVVGRCIDQRNDDPDRILAQHDYRKRVARARPRAARFLQLDAVRPCGACCRRCVHAGGTGPAEQATCREGHYGHGAKRPRSYRLLWPCRS